MEQVKFHFPIESYASGIAQFHKEIADLVDEVKSNPNPSKEISLILVPDSMNKYDKTALKVCLLSGIQIGWIPKKHSKNFKDAIFKNILDYGISYETRLK